jgi:hypothetical protein
MTTPTHLAVDAAVFFCLMQWAGFEVGYWDAVLIAGSNLIDLDHLASRPIYHPKRNPFKTHFLHRHWRALLLVSVAMFFVRPIAFFGLGVVLHLFLDYLYIIREKV